VNEQSEHLVRRALEEVFAGGNLDAISEIFHPEFVNHEAGPRTPPGPEGLKMTVEWLRRSFSDLRYDIKDEIVGADKVVVRVVSSGRHTGEFIGFPPTGKTFSVEQIHIYRIAQGKIIEHWSSRDDLSQGMQLGFIPGGRRPQPSAAGMSSAIVDEHPRRLGCPANDWQRPPRSQSVAGRSFRLTTS
jgi:predicted ester cyclase